MNRGIRNCEKEKKKKKKKYPNISALKELPKKYYVRISAFYTSFCSQHLAFRLHLGRIPARATGLQRARQTGTLQLPTQTPFMS
jgi:hypothetical protein